MMLPTEEMGALYQTFWGGCISFFPSWPLRFMRRGFFINKSFAKVQLLI